DTYTDQIDPSSQVPFALLAVSLDGRANQLDHCHHPPTVRVHEFQIAVGLMANRGESNNRRCIEFDELRACRTQSTRFCEVGIASGLWCSFASIRLVFP